MFPGIAPFKFFAHHALPLKTVSGSSSYRLPPQAWSMCEMQAAARKAEEAAAAATQQLEAFQNGSRAEETGAQKQIRQLREQLQIAEVGPAQCNLCVELSRVQKQTRSGSIGSSSRSQRWETLSAAW